MTLTEQGNIPHVPGCALRAMVGDSVWEDVTVTILDGWFRIDFEAPDLDSVQFKLSDLFQDSSS